MKIIEGDLIQMTFSQKFDVIAHGCNCFCTMGAGIALQMAYKFDCHKFPLEGPKYRGDIDKLGNIDSDWHDIGPLEGHDGWDVGVVNAYTQFKPGADLSYAALELCLMKINKKFKGLKLGLPLIGGGIAGGDPETIINLMLKTLTDVDATLVLYHKNSDNDRIKSIFSKAKARLQESQSATSKESDIQTFSEGTQRQRSRFGL